MKRLRGILVPVAVVLSLILPMNPVSATSSDDVARAIQDQLPEVQSVLTSVAKSAGVKVSDANQLTLGEGYEVYGVSQKALEGQAQRASDFVKLIDNFYVFPVLIDKTPVGVVWVEKIDGEWVIVGEGTYRRFNEDIQEARDILTKAGFGNKVYLVYDHTVLLFGLVGEDANGQGKFVPIRDLTPVYGLRRGTLVDLDEVGAEVRKFVQELEGQGGEVTAEPVTPDSHGEELERPLIPSWTMALMSILAVLVAMMAFQLARRWKEEL